MVWSTHLERALDVPGDAELAEAARGGRRRGGREGGVVAARGRAAAGPALPAPHGREVTAALRAHGRHR